MSPGAADVRVTLEIWPQMIHAWPLWNARLEPGRPRSPAPAHLSGNIFEATRGTGRLEQLQQPLVAKIAGLSPEERSTTLFLSF